MTFCGAIAPGKSSTNSLSKIRIEISRKGCLTKTANPIKLFLGNEERVSAFLGELMKHKHPSIVATKSRTALGAKLV